MPLTDILKHESTKIYRRLRKFSDIQTNEKRRVVVVVVVEEVEHVKQLQKCGTCNINTVVKIIGENLNENEFRNVVGVDKNEAIRCGSL